MRDKKPALYCRVWIIFLYIPLSISCSNDLVFGPNSCLEEFQTPPATEISSNLEIAGRWRLMIQQIILQCDDVRATDSYLKSIHTSVLNIDTVNGEIIHYIDGVDQSRTLGTWSINEPLTLTLDLDIEEQGRLPYFESITLYITNTLTTSPTELYGTSTFDFADKTVAQGRFELIKLND